MHIPRNVTRQPDSTCPNRIHRGGFNTYHAYYLAAYWASIRVEPDIKRYIRHLEIRTRGQVDSMMSGAYSSTFRGRGLEFAEVRPYQPGDDVRAIDWNVSARMGETYVKLFEEEREQTIMLAVDVSGSQAFGSAHATKRTTAAEAAALVAFTALHQHDAVGLLLFTDRIEALLPPRNTRRHVLHALQRLLTCEPDHTRTNLNVPLRYLLNSLERRATVLFISDFMDTQYTDLLHATARRHDLIGAHVFDPGEATLPPHGLLDLTDPETGTPHTVDARDPSVQRRLQTEHDRRHRRIEDMLHTANAGHIALPTDGDVADALVTFFRHRRPYRA